MDKKERELVELNHALRTQLMTARLNMRLVYNLLSLAEMEDDQRPAVRSVIDILRKALIKKD